MMAIGSRRRISSNGRLKGSTSQKTDSSRIRRAMSWVYCDPKSRMRTARRVMAWSAGPVRDGSSASSVDPLARHLDRGGVAALRAQRLDAGAVLRGEMAHEAQIFALDPQARPVRRRQTPAPAGSPPAHGFPGLRG